MNKYFKHMLRYLKDIGDAKKIRNISIYNNDYEYFSLREFIYKTFKNTNFTEDELLSKKIHFLKTYVKKYNDNCFNGEISIVQWNSFCIKHITIQGNTLKQILQKIYDSAIECASENNLSPFNIMFTEKYENKQYILIFFTKSNDINKLKEEIDNL